jgi:alpha-amylase/alpha-mannosidase (GH57 family)
MVEKFICIHGHFYQPPRENPWLEEVEFEESARPYHDWNARVTAECYAPNSVSRIMDPEWRIIGLVNNYSKISFNFGPTLLYWLARHEPVLYQSILDADKESAKNFSGHGSAIAQVYNHMIMPLANKRDKETQVKWGIKDFEVRFGRYPEGMWLPETAVDIETLETLAENGIKFTILAPHQALHIRRIGEKDWIDVQEAKIDPRKAYVCPLPSGKKISLFFFDQFKASDASFGDMLSNGDVFANRLLEGFQNEPVDAKALLSNVASDGEVYGHHRIHGDMTLAYCLYYIQFKNLARTTNYAEFLEKFPPEFEVEIKENTSWSCSHGVERWRNDCGCNTGRVGWHQAWRKPLREAMNWLRDELASKFESEAAKYLKDPWIARENYINVVFDRSKENVQRFVDAQKNRDLSEDEKKQVMKLLEMQRQAMLMFTSCGWFFDEISGIETVQVMMYAARAMQLAKEVLGLGLENNYIKTLEQAPSNIREFENGAKTYGLLVKTAVIDFSKIGAQSTILRLFSNEKTDAPITIKQYGCCFTLTDKELERREAGKFRLVTSYSSVRSAITLDEAMLACAAIWLGDHNVSCGVKIDADEAFYKTMKDELTEKFSKGEINEAILQLPKYFGENNYSLKDVFRDDQIKILGIIVQDAVKKATELNEIIYRDNLAFLRFMNEIRIPSPKSFRTATEIVLNDKISQMLKAEEINVEDLSKSISDSKALSIEFESDLVSLDASEKIVKEFSKLLDTPPDSKKLENLDKLMMALNQLPLKLELWHAQNIAFEIAQKTYKPLKEKKDEDSQKWVLAYEKLCKSIGIRLD